MLMAELKDKAEVLLLIGTPTVSSSPARWMCLRLPPDPFRIGWRRLWQSQSKEPLPEVAIEPFVETALPGRKRASRV